jgi:hypothetical protein
MTRERVPLDWARTKEILGNALTTLGEKESGTGKLEEAVAAYREALKEMTRERMPLECGAQFSHGLLDFCTTGNACEGCLRTFPVPAGTAGLRKFRSFVGGSVNVSTATVSAHSRYARQPSCGRRCRKD